MRSNCQATGEGGFRWFNRFAETCHSWRIVNFRWEGDDAAPMTQVLAATILPKSPHCSGPSV
jgi:hypothetical protein